MAAIGSRPAYLRLGCDALASRARRAVATLADCRACPRDCGVNRLEDHWAACKTGRYAVVSSFFPHFGEEDCLRGWNGSGTIFFAHCNLRCVFCQNFDISQDIKPASARGSTPREIATMMLWLQAHEVYTRMDRLDARLGHLRQPDGPVLPRRQSGRYGVSGNQPEADLCGVSRSAAHRERPRAAASGGPLPAPAPAATEKLVQG